MSAIKIIPDDPLTEDRDHWIETVSGKKFHLLTPRQEEIDIEDIAHALSMICRYTGHLKVHYSVAEHCVRVAEITPTGLKFAALLHDAAEAYVGDVNHPLKALMRKMNKGANHQFDIYSVLEERILRAIFQKFSVPWEQEAMVEKYDALMGSAEAFTFMSNIDGWTFPHGVRFDYEIVPMPAELARREFLGAFERYARDFRITN